jgi:ribosomal protein S18 acetylase RimI-like enzyme
MLIRNITIDDNKDVLKLGRLLFREEDEIPYLIKAIDTRCKELSYVIMDNIDNSELIGFILVCKKMTKIYDKFITKIPNCYELAFFGIHPSYHGKGLGSQCLKITLSSIYQACIQFNCWLIVDMCNSGAIKLYKKLGFRQWKTFYNEKIPCCIMGLSYRRWKIT